jgi:hypothetical protein
VFEKMISQIVEIHIGQSSCGDNNKYEIISSIPIRTQLAPKDGNAQMFQDEMQTTLHNL